MLIAAETGFSIGDGYVVGILFAGIALFAAVGALSQRGQRAFTAAIVYLGLGAVLSVGLDVLGTELLDPFKDERLIERVTEIALVVTLFSAGLKLDRPLGWARWRTPVLLLAVVMPVTIVAVTGLGVWLLGLPLGAAMVLAGALAPTDPVLATDVQVGPPGEREEPEPRFALTAEAGLNDGLAFPFVLLGVFVIERDGSGWLGEWLVADVLYAIVVGVVVGALAGRGFAALVLMLHRRGWLAPALDGWLAIPTVLVVYGLAEAVGAYGFLGAFAAGLAFARDGRRHEFHARVHSGSETVEHFMELAVVLMIGSTLTLTGLGVPGIGGWLLVAALLFLVRPTVTLVTLAGSPSSVAERVFMGWFGIRGIGSFYYVAVAIGAGVLAPGDAEKVYWTVIACAVVSIVLHGLSALPSTRRLRL